MITRITYGPQHELCAIIIICLCVCLLRGFQCLNLMNSNWDWPILTKNMFSLFCIMFWQCFSLFEHMQFAFKFVKKSIKYALKRYYEKKIDKGVKNLKCTAKDLSYVYPYCLFGKQILLNNISIFTDLQKIEVLKIFAKCKKQFSNIIKLECFLNARKISCSLLLYDC